MTKNKSLSPVLASRKMDFKKRDDSVGSQKRPPIGAVLHKHPLHVDKGSPIPSMAQQAEHSFASIVKTQQHHQAAASRKHSDEGQSPVNHRTHDDAAEPSKPLLDADEDESLVAYANELAKDI